MDRGDRPVIGNLVDTASQRQEKGRAGRRIDLIDESSGHQ